MYDLVIIGSGPGGAVLAKELTRLSPQLKVAAIDGLSRGQTKVCGGLLSPDSKKALSSLDIEIPENIKLSPKAPLVDTLDLERGIWKKYERDYLNTDRQGFDRYLNSLTPRLDRFCGRCVGIAKIKGLFFTKIVSEGETFILKSRLVAGADGAFSIVRRSLFPKEKIHRYTAIQEWYKGVSPDLPDYSCIYDEKTSDSCSWTIRKEDFYVFGGAFGTKGCKEAFEEQKSRLEERFGEKFPDPERKEACLVCCPRKKREIFLGYDGAYLVGEAAGLISASSFEGISSAIKSGRYLAEAIAKGIDIRAITKRYYRKTRLLRIKIALKIPKMKILTNPKLRSLIMKSGITAKK